MYNKTSNTKLFLPFSTDRIEQVTGITVAGGGTFISDTTSKTNTFFKSNGLVYQNWGATPITLNNSDYCIEFLINMTGDSVDWDNIFAFGTHNNAGGDSTTYNIGFTWGQFRLASLRNGSDLMAPATYTYSSFVGSWKHIAVTRKNNVTRAFVEGHKVIEGSLNTPTSVNNFYFNGSGGRVTGAHSLARFRMQVGEAIYTQDFVPDKFIDPPFKVIVDKYNTVYGYK